MFGIRVEGKAIRVERVMLADSIEQFVCAYEFDFFDKELLQRLFANPNSKVEIFYDEEKIKTCYIDTIQEKKNLEGHSMTVVGRGSLCDLVDSTVCDLDFSNQIKYVDLIEKLVSPFGVKVVDKVGITGTLKNIQFDYETKTFQAINKYARNFGVILDEDESGNLTITKREKEINGRYTERDFPQIEYEKRFDQLYHTYVVTANGQEGKKGVSEDRKMRFRFFRKEIEVAEDVQQVAKHIHDVRISQSESVSISSIPGFRFKNRKRIQTNSLIRLTTDRLDSEFLITGYTVTQNREGVTTDLKIKRKDTYDLQDDKDIL